MWKADLRWSVVIELSGEELAESLLALAPRREREARDALYRLRQLNKSGGGVPELYERLRGMGSELIRVEMPKHSYDGIKLALAGIKKPSSPELAAEVSLESRKAILKKISEPITVSSPELQRSASEAALDRDDLDLLESKL